MGGVSGWSYLLIITLGSSSSYLYYFCSACKHQTKSLHFQIVTDFVFHPLCTFLAARDRWWHFPASRLQHCVCESYGNNRTNWECWAVYARADRDNSRIRVCSCHSCGRDWPSLLLHLVRKWNHGYCVTTIIFKNYCCFHSYSRRLKGQYSFVEHDPVFTIKNQSYEPSQLERNKVAPSNEGWQILLFCVFLCKCTYLTSPWKQLPGYHHLMLSASS